MRQHAYLPAMMGLMHDNVAKHGGAYRPWLCPTVATELLNPPLCPTQRLSKHLRATARALRKRTSPLMLRRAAAIHLRGRLQMRRREPYPLSPDVVYVSKYRGDGPH